MAAVANSNTYLDFSRTPGKNSKPVLWPVRIHRVLYPEPRQPQLNLFQRAVLGLVRAGQDRQDIIAELTGLHPELITLIMAQGVSNGWLDSTASELTVKGSRLLDDEEDDLVNLKAGFLLQDAVTGNYWPRMVTKLEQIEPIDPQAQFPEFASERKTGWKLKPFLVKRTNKELPALSSELLNRAYRDYRKDYRANQKIGGQIQETQRVQLQGVQRLDASPEAAQIILWITKAEHGDEPLAIQDPFKLRKNAWWLLKDFKKKLGEEHNLRRYLANLIDIPDVASLSNEEWLKAIENKVEFDLLIEHAWVERQPDIRRYFSTLLKWREKIEQGSNDDADLEAAIGDCQKLLEVVMQWLIKTYPADAGHTPSQKHFSRDLNLKLLKALKIPSFTDNSINLLARQPLKQVIGACKNPTSSLKALVFAAAIGVIAKPDHPLMVLTSHELDIDKLIELANLRNESSHGRSSFVNKKQTNLTEEIVLENIDFSLNFTTCFKEWM